MANDTGIRYWQVTLNGVPLKRGFHGESGKREAQAMAERWQGQHYGKPSGLLKHKDRGDWVEVKRDTATEKEMAERFDEARRGNPQRYVVQYNSDYQ